MCYHELYLNLIHGFGIGSFRQFSCSSEMFFKAFHDLSPLTFPHLLQIKQCHLWHRQWSLARACPWTAVAMRTARTGTTAAGTATATMAGRCVPSSPALCPPARAPPSALASAAPRAQVRGWAVSQVVWRDHLTEGDLDKFISLFWVSLGRCLKGCIVLRETGHIS